MMIFKTLNNLKKNTNNCSLIKQMAMDNVPI